MSAHGSDQVGEASTNEKALSLPA